VLEPLWEGVESSVVPFETVDENDEKQVGLDWFRRQLQRVSLRRRIFPWVKHINDELFPV